MGITSIKLIMVILSQKFSIVNHYRILNKKFEAAFYYLSTKVFKCFLFALLQIIHHYSPYDILLKLEQGFA